MQEAPSYLAYLDFYDLGDRYGRIAPLEVRESGIETAFHPFKIWMF